MNEQSKSETERSVSSQEQVRFAITQIDTLLENLREKVHHEDHEAREGFRKAIFRYDKITTLLTECEVSEEDSLETILKKLEQRKIFLAREQRTFRPEPEEVPVSANDNEAREQIMGIQDKINALYGNNYETEKLLTEVKEGLARLAIFKTGVPLDQTVEVLTTPSGNVEIFFGNEQEEARDAMALETSIKDTQARIKFYEKIIAASESTPQPNLLKRFFGRKEEIPLEENDDDIRPVFGKELEQMILQKGRTENALVDLEKKRGKSFKDLQSTIGERQKALGVLLLTSGQMEFSGTWSELLVLLENGAATSIESFEADLQETDRAIAALEGERNAVESKKAE